MSRREFWNAVTNRRIIIETGIVIGRTGARLVAVELVEATYCWLWTVRSLPDGAVLRNGCAGSEATARRVATEGGVQ